MQAIQLWSMANSANLHEKIEVRSRQELRNWLENNHQSSSAVWLVTFKKHTDHYLSFGELIEELLCWGWIDSRSKGVDQNRTSVLIAPRNPRSAWSAVNKSKVESARASGAMTPAGEAAVLAAKANGMWEFLDDVERLELPEDLSEILTGRLRSVWEDYPKSVRRGSLEWIKTAKTSLTRARRIEDVRISALNGQRPSPFRR